jgi:hypothetical protein
MVGACCSSSSSSCCWNTAGRQGKERHPPRDETPCYQYHDKADPGRCHVGILVVLVVPECLLDRSSSATGADGGMTRVHFGGNDLSARHACHVRIVVHACHVRTI